MIISIIVAVAKNNVIGQGNKLIWHISEDLKRFKKLTNGHHIIMGRKTFESIGKALPNRINIVVTRDKNYDAPGCVIATSLDEAFELSKNDIEVFIIGGGEIYRQAIPYADHIYLTKVDAEFKGDTFFPALNPEDWIVETSQKGVDTVDGGFEYSFINLVKRRH